MFVHKAVYRIYEYRYIILCTRRRPSEDYNIAGALQPYNIVQNCSTRRVHNIIKSASWLQRLLQQRRRRRRLRWVDTVLTVLDLCPGQKNTTHTDDDYDDYDYDDDDAAGRYSFFSPTVVLYTCSRRLDVYTRMQSIIMYIRVYTLTYTRTHTRHNIYGCAHNKHP